MWLVKPVPFAVLGDRCLSDEAMFSGVFLFSLSRDYVVGDALVCYVD